MTATPSSGVSWWGRDEARVLGALTHLHREEQARLAALVVRYREFIEDHGLEPPDDSGAEALARFRHVFRLAGLNDDLQHNELVANWPSTRA